jgi:hypothetical protein
MSTGNAHQKLQLGSLFDAAAELCGFDRVLMCRTVNQLEAELVDLVESMAAVTKRTLKWSGGRVMQGGARLISAESASSRSMGKTSTKGSTPRWSSRIPAITSKRTPGQSVYIIHEPDAHAHALRLRDAILLQTDKKDKKQCYTDIATSTEGMEVCLKRVASSGYVILLQTSAVLKHPWPLLAAYHADLASVPLVCVSVSAGGYEFGAVEHHLMHLSEQIDPAALEQMASVLSGWTPPRTVAELQSKLYKLIPHIISVVYNPYGSDNEFAATIRDIHDKQSLLQVRFRRRSTSSDADTFLQEAQRLSKEKGQQSTESDQGWSGRWTAPSLAV